MVNPARVSSNGRDCEVNLHRMALLRLRRAPDVEAGVG